MIKPAEIKQYTIILLNKIKLASCRLLPPAHLVKLDLQWLVLYTH